MSSRAAVSAFFLSTILLATTAAASADDGCFRIRGRQLTAHAGSVAVSGQVVALLQQGSWDTRPMVRVVAFGPFGAMEVGHWQPIWYVEDIALDVSTAFVTADHGLFALDLSDPTNPVELDFIALADARHLTIDGDRAYVVSISDAGNGWLDIIDISDPKEMERLGYVSWECPDSENLAIDASGESVVVSDGRSLLVFDVSDPWHPAECGVWRRNGSRDVVLVNDLAAVAITSSVDPDDDGLELVDLSAPDDPTPAGFWPAPSAVRSVAEYGGAVLAGTDSDGLFLVDIDDPAHPIVLDHWQASGQSVEHLATAWPTIAASDSARGTVVLGLDPSCLPPRNPSGRQGP